MIHSVKSEWRTGYAVVLTGGLGMASQSAGFLSLGTLLPAIISDTGWSRSDVVGVGVAVAIICFVFSPIVGRLVDRFGARPLALAGSVLYPLSLASIALTGASVWGWWACWLGIGLATQFINPMVWSFAVSRRFFRHRGLAMGLALSGVGLTNAVAPMLSIILLESFAWRWVFVALGLIIFLTLAPTVYFLFRDTPAVHDEVDGEASESPARYGLSPKEAFATTRYWRLSFGVLIVAAAVGMINLHLQTILIEGGATGYEAAAIATIFGPAQIAGRLVGGFLLDRMHGSILGAILFMAPVISLLLMLAGISHGALALVIPLCAGLAAGVEVDLAAYLSSRYFGTRSFGAIFSIVYGFHAVGYALAPTVAAAVRDASGSYNPFLITMACLLPLAALAVGTLGPYPDRAAAKI